MLNSSNNCDVEIDFLAFRSLPRPLALPCWRVALRSAFSLSALASWDIWDVLSLVALVTRPERRGSPVYLSLVSVSEQWDRLGALPLEETPESDADEDCWIMGVSSSLLGEERR